MSNNNILGDKIMPTYNKQEIDPLYQYGYRFNWNNGSLNVFLSKIRAYYTLPNNFTLPYPYRLADGKYTNILPKGGYSYITQMPNFTVPRAQLECQTEKEYMTGENSDLNLIYRARGYKLTDEELEIYKQKSKESIAHEIEYIDNVMLPLGNALKEGCKAQKGNRDVLNDLYDCTKLGISRGLRIDYELLKPLLEESVKQLYNDKNVNGDVTKTICYKFLDDIASIGAINEMYAVINDSYSNFPLDPQSVYTIGNNLVLAQNVGPEGRKNLIEKIRVASSVDTLYEIGKMNNNEKVKRGETAIKGAFDSVAQVTESNNPRNSNYGRNR